MLGSTVCRFEHLSEPWFDKWNKRFTTPQVSRKNWEWCAIAEALHSRDMLVRGRKGLGFAVGWEPLPSLFASFGPEIIATDLAPELSEPRWTDTAQHAGNLDLIFRPETIDRQTFDQNVRFQHADMRTLEGLPHNAFDFLWSSCSLEHLGSMENSLNFVVNAMDLLKPGGIAVHTTEYNVSSNTDTMLDGSDVIFRRQDVELLDCKLRHKECGLDRVDFYAGNHKHDLACDFPPYFNNGRMHIKLRLHGYVATSIMLIAFKP